jgi:predicted dehydrogenase
MTGGILRLAIAGCGAVTEVLQLPGLRSAASVKPTLFVDTHLSRAQVCAAQFGARASSDLWAAPNEFDAVLVCTSPHSHYEICRRALEAGKHVLCEKPFVLSSTQARELQGLAKSSGLVMAVCHVRRLFWNSKLIKSLFCSGLLPDVQTVVMEDGRPYSWPQKSGDIFTPEKAAGVFLANGIHCLDLLYWWCDGRLELVEHLSDAEGGPEANTITKLRCRAGEQQFEAILKFSTTRQLANRITISCARGEVVVPSLPDARVLDVSLPALQQGWHGEPADADKQKCCSWQKADAPDIISCHSVQLQSFAKACRGEAAYYLPTEDVVREIELGEECAGSAKPIPAPWADVSPELARVAALL